MRNTSPRQGLLQNGDIRDHTVDIGNRAPGLGRAAGQLYEITLEPSGGSPTGRPTGPIQVKGFAKSPL